MTHTVVFRQLIGTNFYRTFAEVKRTFGMIITETEIAAFQRTAVECYRRTKTKYTPEYWIPIQWAQRLILKSLYAGYILDPKTAYYLIDVSLC